MFRESSHKPNGFIKKVSKYFDSELLRSGLRSMTLRTRRGEKYFDVSEELKSNIMEFINAPIGQHNNLVNESHPQACDTSSLLNFTSKELNEILENEMLNEDLVSEDLSECTVNLKSLDSQASVRANEMLVSEDLNDYMIKDLESLAEKQSRIPDCRSVYSQKSSGIPQRSTPEPGPDHVAINYFLANYTIIRKSAINLKDSIYTNIKQFLKIILLDSF
ncbi:16437_t:CDS:2 [Rhizophagus irregularis]|nr:16437_t:CDS:2 [Rhizophagus irregularis]